MKVIGADSTGITKVAVIGAGAMGGGIAAQFANSGIEVELLDMRGGDNGNGPAEAGLARQLKIGGFMSPEAATLVRVGNVQDDLARLAEVDWVVEAIIEKVEIKHDLYAAIAPHLKPDAILSSNTSTIPRAVLTANMPADLAKRFAITHFFNPPRIMRLLEIITAPDADAALVAKLDKASATLLGKTTIICKDTPGFIANRIGCFWLAASAFEARRLGLTIETADAVNAALGIPRTGVFGLFDLIGIDLVPTVWGSLLQALPATDALHRFDITTDTLFRTLVERGAFGRKAGAGFYRKASDGTLQALDLATLEYRARQEPAPLPGRDPASLIADQGPIGVYARAVLGETLAYAATHAPEIADNAGAIDVAMELGYSWRQGPFALAEKAGLKALAETLPEIPAFLQRGLDEGFYVKGAPLAVAGGRAAPLAGTPLADLPIIASNAFATLHDLGDGVACFRAHTKMNTFDPGIFELMEETLERAGKDFTALVIANEDPRAFSAGADLAFFMRMVDSPDGPQQIAAYGTRGQGLFMKMLRAPVPVVAAVHGFALGGGCEFQMHTDATIAHAEANIGLPETAVGLVPGWGGCTRLYARALAADPSARPVEIARRAFTTLFAGKIANSAAQAKSLGLLRPDDGIVMLRSDLTQAAKEKALALVSGYKSPAALDMPVAGPTGKEELMESVRPDLATGKITTTDLELADTLATILTGGLQAGETATEAEMMALEAATLARLVTWPPSRARVEHMLATGKYLKN